MSTRFCTVCGMSCRNEDGSYHYYRCQTCERVLCAGCVEIVPAAHDPKKNELVEESWHCPGEHADAARVEQGLKEMDGEEDVRRWIEEVTKVTPPRMDVEQKGNVTILRPVKEGDGPAVH